MAADAAPGFVYLEALPEPGAECALEGDEAHYLSRVVRARPGELVRASDGRGGLATLEVLESRPHVRVLGRERSRSERTGERTLWVGAPEGDRADWLVEKLAELGVHRLVLVDFERAAWERAEARRERWQRLATAGLRQSQSAWRLEIAPPVPLAEALRVAEPAARRWVALPGASAVRDWAGGDAGPRVGVVGPSPGFSEDELKVLQESGFAPIGLGPSRLRTETAALALASLWQAASGV
ncbi:MAG: 16S rRNA (uracil(1498)-N(3))-methyltransferase [Candidatus Eisenbacteria bacterium]